MRDWLNCPTRPGARTDLPPDRVRNRSIEVRARGPDGGTDDGQRRHAEATSVGSAMSSAATAATFASAKVGRFATGG